MKKNKKARVIELKLKDENSPNHNSQNFSPELSRLKDVDSVFNEVVNSAGELVVNKSSQEEYDNLMEQLMRMSVLLGGWYCHLNNREYEVGDMSLVGEVNRLRERNKQLEKALLHHKKVTTNSEDVKALVTELLIEALEELQPY